MDTANTAATLATHLDGLGFPSLAEGVLDFDADLRAGTNDVTPARFVGLLDADLRACQTVHDDDPDPDTYAEAFQVTEALLRAWAPKPMPTKAEAVEDALHAACRAVQDALGVTDGLHASHYWTGSELEAFQAMLGAYYDAEADDLEA